MTRKELFNFMSFNKNGGRFVPLYATEVNGSFIIAVYKGSFSKYDILIKYRQKNEDKWSRIRTPKHIHWTVDILIKMHFEDKKTKEFLDFLIQVWKNTKPFKTKQDRINFLNPDNLLEVNQKEILHYEKLNNKGEYNIKFLILLAKLLMAQEKTNLEEAYMFKKLLVALKSGGDIFKIVSIATHR
jgi:hypothetical protein